MSKPSTHWVRMNSESLQVSIICKTVLFFFFKKSRPSNILTFHIPNLIRLIPPRCPEACIWSDWQLFGTQPPIEGLLFIMNGSVSLSAFQFGSELIWFVGLEKNEEWKPERNQKFTRQCISRLSKLGGSYAKYILKLWKCLYMWALQDHLSAVWKINDCLFICKEYFVVL